MKEAYVSMIREDKDQMEKIRVGPSFKEKDLQCGSSGITRLSLSSENGSRAAGPSARRLPGSASLPAGGGGGHDGGAEAGAGGDAAGAGATSGGPSGGHQRRGAEHQHAETDGQLRRPIRARGGDYNDAFHLSKS